MKLLQLLAPASLFLTTLTFAGEPPANSALILEDAFQRDELGKGWKATTGKWSIENGVLVGRELVEEKHSAAIRRVLLTDNAVYELKFRFVKSGKSFHFGFDPAHGELKKKGHLFSVIVTRAGWKIMKHLDKNNRKEDPNETLAEQKMSLEIGKWHELRVTTWGTSVTASIDDSEKLKAFHPTFGVKKPALVFRCLGDGVELDSVRVWRPIDKQAEAVEEKRE